MQTCNRSVWMYFPCLFFVCQYSQNHYNQTSKQPPCLHHFEPESKRTGPHYNLKENKIHGCAFSWKFLAIVFCYGKVVILRNVLPMGKSKNLHDRLCRLRLTRQNTHLLIYISADVAETIIRFGWTVLVFQVFGPCKTVGDETITSITNLTLVIPMCIWTNKCESNSV